MRKIPFFPLQHYCTELGEEERELEKYEMVRNMVRSKLQESGNLDRLRCYIQRRLTATGWKGDMMKELRVAVNEMGVCNITVERLYERIAIHGRNIDKRLEEDALNKIKHSYKGLLNETGNRNFDQIPNLYHNDSIGKIRYINQHRK